MVRLNFFVAFMVLAAPLAAQFDLHNNGERIQPVPELRDYYRDLSESERKDIRFLLVTLGSGYFRCLRYKKDLMKAGSRVGNVHPLAYLKEVFAHQDSRQGIGQARKLGLIWSKFMNGDEGQRGIKQSFAVESSLGNVTDEQLQDFAAAARVDIEEAAAAYRKKNWGLFIDLLIDQVSEESRRTDRKG